MRKTVVSFLTIMILTFSANAQVYDGAIGLRLSASNYGFGPEISYQYGLSDASRIEAGIGFSVDNNYNRFGVTGAYQMVFEVESGFSWFVGPGAQLWLYSYSNNVLNNRGSVGGAVGAQFGVEYDFNELDIPFSASIDTRPMFNFVSNNSGFEFALGISARYTF
jgi:hypothetical protein